MEYVTGEIYDGKVKSIAAFGAFVTLPGGKTGMVHISEVAYTYVADIHQLLQEGQDVKVMVLSADPAGKINLSIKRTMPQEAAPQRQPRENRPPRTDRAPQDRPRQEFRRTENREPRAPRQDRPAMTGRSAAPPPAYSRPAAPADQSFEDKLKAFMSESDSKLSSVKQYSDHRTKSRRR